MKRIKFIVPYLMERKLSANQDFKEIGLGISFDVRDKELIIALLLFFVKINFEPKRKEKK